MRAMSPGDSDQRGEARVVITIKANGHILFRSGLGRSVRWSEGPEGAGAPMGDPRGAARCGIRCARVRQQKKSRGECPQPPPKQPSSQPQ